MKKILAAMLALLLFCFPGLGYGGHAYAAGPGERPATEPDEELQRACSAGLLPEDWLGNMEQTVSFSEYSGLAAKLVESWDESRLEEWQEQMKLAAGSDEPMDTEDGFLLLSYLWIMMGYQVPQLPVGYEPWAGGDQELRDAQGENLSWDYPLFPDYDTVVYTEYNSNYIWGALQIFPDVCSAVSGERVFQYDEEEQSLHLDEPLSRDTAVRALLRLGEYRDGLVFDAVIDEDILPDHSGTDFAVGATFEEGKAELGFSFRWEFPLSETQYSVGTEMSMGFTLLLPDALVRALAEQKGELTCTVDIFGEDMEEIYRSAEDPSFSLSLEGNKLCARSMDGEESFGTLQGNCWRLPILTGLSYQLQSRTAVNLISPRISLNIPGYEGSFYVDDLLISSLGKELISCDFDYVTAYGRSGEEQFSFNVTDGRLWTWTAADLIGAEEKSDALRIGVNFTGESYEPNSGEFLESVDTGLLHNQENDWRNWGGFTGWWHSEGRVDSQVTLEYGLIIPKDLDFSDEVEETGLNLGGGFGFGSYDAYDGEGNEELKEYEAPNINIYPGCNGNTVINTWGDGEISVTAYNDCYYVRYTGSAEVPETDYELAVVKLSWTGDAVSYSGYFYLTDFSLSCGGETILSYTSGEDAPEELFHCYNHGTNGSYYYWKELGSSNYNLGFEALAVKG